MNAVDRAIMALAPRWGFKRAQWRTAAQMLERFGPESIGGRRRHFEAAQQGRRTEHWKRSHTDANSAHGPALHILRALARDLCRNDPFARRAKRIIANNTIGWGMLPRPTGDHKRSKARARQLWKAWAGSKQCDYYGRLDMGGLQRMVIKTTAESGEVLARRYRRPLSEGLAIPLQVQLLEPDFIDTAKDGQRTPSGGRIIQGIELNARDRIEAYWLFPEHPGQNFMYSRLAPSSASRPVPAEDILHVFDPERIGGVRGVTWYAAVIARLENYGVLDDSELMKHQVAACLSVLITDVDGSKPPMGTPSKIDTSSFSLEPGMAKYLPVGSDVKVVNPPQVTDSQLAERTLAAVAMGLGVTVEDLTGNYRQMPFSAARMSRLAHWSNVYDWRWQIMAPMFCDPVWSWAMETAHAAGLIEHVPGATWSAPPMPMIEPDKEGLAEQRNVRTGLKTVDEMILEQGGDPDTHWENYAEALKRLDDHGIILDSDARYRTQQGNAVVTTSAKKPSGAGNGGNSGE